jgi:hypothetical protein
VTSDCADLLHLGMPVSAWSSRPISVWATPPSLTVGRLIWSQLVSRRLHNETVEILCTDYVHSNRPAAAERWKRGHRYIPGCFMLDEPMLASIVAR